ncbi:two-component sensor histidine kinase, partial [Streptomyces sp. NPDC060131]
MRGFFRQRRSVSPPGHPYDRTGPGEHAGSGEHAGPGARTGPGGRPRVLGVRGLRARGIRTGLRWKLSAAIALVGALVA